MSESGRIKLDEAKLTRRDLCRRLSGRSTIGQVRAQAHRTNGFWGLSSVWRYCFKEPCRRFANPNHGERREPLCVAAELHVVNVDFSPIAIEAMRQIQNSDIGAMRNQWLVADIRDMPFQSSSFDLVIDKGTFDAFEASPIRSPDQGTHASDADGVASLFKEVNRVLKVSADAAWLQFTHTAPELRLEVLSRVAQREAWHIGYKSLGEDENGFEYFVYFLRRRPKFELVRAERDQVAAQVGLFVEEAEASAARACLSGSATHVDEERYVVRSLL